MTQTLSISIELQIAIKRHNIIHATLLKASMFYKH